MMRLRVLLIALWAALGCVGQAQAQDQAWLQIEAQPTLAKAQDRAMAYTALFPDVTGFQVSTGWYAILIGPYPQDQASTRLASLKQDGMIPADSFLTDGSGRGQQFWPPEQAGATLPATETATAPVAATEPAETLAEAKASEAGLSADDRMTLQEAMSWYGFYNAAIDGSFGSGTRKSMQDWQEANGFEGTGVLTTRQRSGLLTKFHADKAEFGFATVTDSEAGIEITLPLSLVKFDHYEPPFVHYDAANGSGMRVMLMSEPGDTFSLDGLYHVLQTLEVVPATGDRSIGKDAFTINAQSDQVQSYAYAEAKNGTVKGYLVVWKPADAARMARILPVLQSSFRAVGSKALDPGLVPMDAAAKAGLLAGMEVKTPKLSRSGFYVDAKGSVVTTLEAVTACSRISIDHDTDARVVASDPGTGLAILAPQTPLSPDTFASFQSAVGATGADITVAGYSYEGKLPAPVLTYGTLEEDKGLNGEAGVERLSVAALPGDAGGPVLDQSGAVLGMVLPAPAKGAKQLPDGVAFAASAAVIEAALTAAGITATTSTATDIATPDALNAAGSGMTVLVSCWE